MELTNAYHTLKKFAVEGERGMKQELKEPL